MSSLAAFSPREPVRLAQDWPRLRREADRLLDLQLWVLGLDIRHADGNAPLAYGCARVRAPAGRGGTSAYLPPDSAGAVIWWGFGAAARIERCDGGVSTGAAVFVERHAFGPRLLATAPVLPLWAPSQLPRSTHPRTDAAWADAAAGIARIASSFVAYERWVAERLDPAERRRAMEDRMRSRGGSAARRAPEWELTLAARWTRLLSVLPSAASLAWSGVPAAPSVRRVHALSTAAAVGAERLRLERPGALVAHAGHDLPDRTREGHG